MQVKKANEINQNAEKDFISSNLQNEEQNERIEEIKQEEKSEQDDIKALSQEKGLEQSVIGYLTIPDILLENAPICEGTDLETLAKSIGHFSSTSIYSGNVGLASHNSGGRGDYFKNLKDISIGSIIYYKTNYGTRRYIVSFKQEISEDDFSYLKENSNNRITLITCVKGEKNKRLCVQALEYKE